jgi:hypothetical protein
MIFSLFFFFGGGLGGRAGDTKTCVGGSQLGPRSSGGTPTWRGLGGGVDLKGITTLLEEPVFWVVGPRLGGGGARDY